MLGLLVGCVLGWPLGWLLGFRSETSYNLSTTAANDLNVGYVDTNDYAVTDDNSVVTLTGDTPVNINIYNQLHVIVDTYTSNNMNDGVITVASPSSNTSLQAYARSRRCDVNPVAIGVGGKAVPGFVNTESVNVVGRVAPVLTQAQTYAAAAQAGVKIDLQGNTAKNLSQPVNVKNMFAMVPLKMNGVAVGQTFTENSGTLQQNNRKYSGPVNIQRIGIKLVSDRGDVVDLQNNDWSVGIICDVASVPV